MQHRLTVALLVVVGLVVVNAATLTNTPRMASIDFSKVKVTEKRFYRPPLVEIVEVLTRELRYKFKEVEVSIVDCPDLTQPPFNLTSPGLGGQAKLVEIGGPPYLVPTVQRDKIYDLVEMTKFLGREKAFVTGAGAGPWPFLGVNCEGIINLSVNNGVVDQGSRIVSVNPVGSAKDQASYLQQRLPNNETRTALLGNYLVSEGKPGSVIKVVAKKRIADTNFIRAIRENLMTYYGDQIVGMGGVFIMRAGRAKFHVMPDFSTTALCSDSDVDNWLHFFEMKAPLTVLGTFATGELGLDLRVQHFHGFSEHGDGGHYHHDTTPEEVEYEGYFTLASSIVRIDPPLKTHSIGRD